MDTTLRTVLLLTAMLTGNLHAVEIPTFPVKAGLNTHLHTNEPVQHYVAGNDTWRIEYSPAQDGLYLWAKPNAIENNIVAYTENSKYSVTVAPSTTSHTPVLLAYRKRKTGALEQKTKTEAQLLMERAFGTNPPITEADMGESDNIYGQAVELDQQELRAVTTDSTTSSIKNPQNPPPSTDEQPSEQEVTALKPGLTINVSNSRKSTPSSDQGRNIDKQINALVAKRDRLQAQLDDQLRKNEEARKKVTSLEDQVGLLTNLFEGNDG